MGGIVKIDQIFKKCESITMSKRQDYTTNPDVDNHENFKRSAEIAEWFSYYQDKPYAILIGIKLARLGSLLSNNKQPNNESVEDTFLDLINYCALWMERYSEDIRIRNISSNFWDKANALGQPSTIQPKPAIEQQPAKGPSPSRKR